jgi:PAS domain S-box-containing protein
VTDVLLALAQGCLRPSLAREAAMERTIAEQYEVDMDLAAARGSARALRWLPAGGRTSACLGLWTGRASSAGGREIEVVGALARSGTLARSVGRRVPAAQFPPQALLRAEPLDGSTLVFVVPVTSPERDWGLLAVTGRLDPRMLHSRERHQHWGAALALALDEEERLAGLQGRLTALEEASAVGAALAAERAATCERHQLWLTALQHAVWDWDVTRGTVHWSPRCAELLGITPAELTDSPSEWLDRVHPEDRVALSALLAAQLGGASGPLRIEHRVQHASGGYRWLLCEAVTVADDAGVPARLLGALVDVTERKERELALVAGVLRDPGSGLPNRASVLDRLGTIVARAHRGEADAAVAVLRALTAGPGRRDTEGPADGGPAAAATALAARLEAAARHGDVIGHLGPETLACAFVDRPEETGAARLAAILDDLPGQQRRLVAVGTLPSVLPFDDPADAVRAAEAVAARDVPGLAR